MCGTTPDVHVFHQLRSRSGCSKHFSGPDIATNKKSACEIIPCVVKYMHVWWSDGRSPSPPIRGERWRLTAREDGALKMKQGSRYFPWVLPLFRSRGSAWIIDRKYEKPVTLTKSGCKDELSVRLYYVCVIYPQRSPPSWFLACPRRTEATVYLLGA